LISAKQSQFFLKLKKQRHIYPPRPSIFVAQGLACFARPAAFRIPTLPTVPGSGSRPASSIYDFAKQTQFFLKLKKPKHIYPP